MARFGPERALDRDRLVIELGHIAAAAQILLEAFQTLAHLFGVTLRECRVEKLVEPATWDATGREQQRVPLEQRGARA